MSLKDYTGPANDKALIRSIVGEKIVGVMFSDTGSVMLVVESGHALTFASMGGGAPSYWCDRPSEVANLAAVRHKQLLSAQEAIRDLAAFLPKPPDGAA